MTIIRVDTPKYNESLLYDYDDLEDWENFQELLDKSINEMEPIFITVKEN